MMCLAATMINFADVVVGTQFGDEAKGKITQHLSKTGNYTHCIRTSGGNNAGHTIYDNGKKYVTHSIPTGIIYGIKSIIGPGCVLNIEHFFNELKELEDAGVLTKGKIFVSKDTHIITKEHLEEENNEKSIGTTKRGIGPAYRDKYNRVGKRAKDVPELEPYLIDVYEEFFLNNPSGCRILCEGAQGFGLDIDWGDYPYVTSSHCTTGGAIINGIPHRYIRDVWGVAKIYETYVGSKKFEPDDIIFSKIREVGKEYGATTGRPRQCNWLELDRLIKACHINGVNKLVINKLDVLREVGTWKVKLNKLEHTFYTEKDIRFFITKTIKQHIPNIEIIYSDSPEGV